MRRYKKSGHIDLTEKEKRFYYEDDAWHFDSVGRRFKRGDVLYDKQEDEYVVCFGNGKALSFGNKTYDSLVAEIKDC